MRNCALALALVAVATGCGDSNQSGDMAMDMGVSDLPALPDMARPNILTGDRIVPGADLRLYTVTAGDLIVFYGADGLQAIPKTGGTPMTIKADAEAALVSGDTVFYWTGVTNDLGTLGLWTAAGGAQENVATASVVGLAAQSEDGQYVFFSDGATDLTTDMVTRAVTSLFVKKADGSEAATQVLTQAIGDNRCPVSVRSRGSRFVVAHCPDAGDAGVVTATITAIDATSPGAPVQLVTGAKPNFSLDQAGAKIFTILEAGGEGVVVPTAGGTPVVLGTGVTDGFISKDGTSVIYAKDGPLFRENADNTNPQQLTTTGCRRIADIAADESHVACYTVRVSTSEQDLYIVPTTAGGTPITIANTPTVGLFGRVFTADSSAMIYYTDIDDGTGTVNVRPFAAAGARQVGTRAWLHVLAGDDKVVFNENYAEVGEVGRADLYVVKASTMDEPVLIATRAFSDRIVVTRANDRIVYQFTAEAGKEGIYSAAVP